MRNEPHSAEQRLLQSVPSESPILVLIEAYMDESGTGDNDVAHVLAGYLIKPNQGMEMSRKWRRVLDRYDLPFFHMTDCAAYEQCEPYKSLGREKCIKLATALIKLIKKHCSIGFAVCFSPRFYTLYAGPGSVPDNPYSFSVSTAHDFIQSYVSNAGLSGELSYIFEAGHAKQRHARAVLDVLEDRAEANGTPFTSSFLRKMDAPLLQAADILAWHCQTYIKGRLEGRRVRADFRSLCEIPHEIYHFGNGFRNGTKEHDLTRVMIDPSPQDENPTIRNNILAIYKLDCPIEGE